MLPQIPTYISNLSLNNAPFRFNENFDITQSGAAHLYNSIFAEATHLHGCDVVYIERTLSNPEPIFGEYLSATLETGTPMRLRLEELTAWGGSGDMYTKFGLTMDDTATFYCPTLTFHQAKINPDYDSTDPTSEQFLKFNPKENDLIYYVNGKKLFEIQTIENEAAPGFYVFGNRNTYQMKCKIYSYQHENINMLDLGISDGIKALDGIETINNNIYDIIGNEETNFNTPVTTANSILIDTTEVDPLRG